MGIGGEVEEAGEGAQALAGCGEAGADFGDLLGGVLGIDGELGGAAVCKLGGRVVSGLGGDVALVGGDAAEAPEDECDALGEGFFEWVGGGEALEGDVAVLLPGDG
jgi:hypothetical protein